VLSRPICENIEAPGSEEDWDSTFHTLVQCRARHPLRRGGTLRIRANLARDRRREDAIEEAWAAAVLEPYPYLYSL
jgi:hypothetical protein